MTIRERLTDFIYPRRKFEADLKRVNEQHDEQFGALSEAFNILRHAQAEGWDAQPLSPDQLAAKIQEAGYDSGAIYNLLQQREWETLGASGSPVSSGARQRSVKDSCWLWIYNPAYQWAINLWTNYVFSQQPVIVPLDENAIEPFDEFWTADRNSPVLAADQMQNASRGTLKTGNRFWAYHASELDGETTITEIPYSQITEILYHPHITGLPVFYKRVFRMNDKDITWYYPSWLARSMGVLDAPFGDPDGKTVAEYHEIEPSQRTDKMATDWQNVGAKKKTGTVTVMQAIIWNVKDDDDPFGWPLSCASAAYLKAHKGFMEDRLTVTKVVAMYVRTLKVKGGSRAVSSVIDTIASNVSRSRYTDTNPPPAAGSTQVHNEAIDSRENSMLTGAQDATSDNAMFTWFMALGLGLFQHYVGIDSFRLATAKTMERPIEMQFGGYRAFWQSQLKTMVRIVLEFQNEFNKANFETGATITLDSITTVDMDSVSSAIGRMFQQVFQPALASNALRQEVYQQIVDFTIGYFLQALGGNDLAQQIQLEQAQEPEGDEPEDEIPDTDTDDAEPEEPQEERDQSQALAIVYGLENMLNGTISEEEFNGYFREVIGEQGNE